MISVYSPSIVDKRLEPSSNTHSLIMCPFCGNDRLRASIIRDGNTFHRCLTCRAYVHLNPPLKEEWEVYESGNFLRRISESLGSKPDYKKFEEFKRFLVGDSILEIGPGSGHFLAAAKHNGFRVAGIELSRAHREYIVSRWGIKVSGDPIEQNKMPAASFDNIVSFNCIEHVLKPAEHVRAMERALRPGGRLLISTCNADGLAARIAGKWWAMYRVPDHVSIPTRYSLELLGTRPGLTPIRIWTSEYPLETVASFALAVRDWWADKTGPDSKPTPTKVTESHLATSGIRSLGHRVMQSSIFSLVARTISAFGAGASIKVLYQKTQL